MAFVQFSDATRQRVIGVFARHQAHLPDTDEVGDDDPRVAAFMRPSAASRAAGRLAGGLGVEWASEPALTGRYAATVAAASDAMTVAQYVAAFGAFPAGRAEVAWPDRDGVPHVFKTTSSFTALARALLDYSHAVRAAAEADAPWPSDAVIV